MRIPTYVLATLIMLTCNFTSATGNTDVTWNTKHFKAVKAKFEDDFYVFAMCTLSGGKVQKKAELLDGIPTIGSSLATAVDWASLNIGEGLCGLAHRRKGKILSLHAKSKGFGLKIKGYDNNGKTTGTVSPSFFCHGKVPILGKVINRFGFCFEKISEREQGFQKPTGISACIERYKINNNKPVKSLVIHIGNVPNNLIIDNNKVLSVGCKNRTY